jgi:hypothetical protein
LYPGIMLAVAGAWWGIAAFRGWRRHRASERWWRRYEDDPDA